MKNTQQLPYICYVVPQLIHQDNNVEFYMKVFFTALPNSVQRAAHHIANKAGELDIVQGRSPISVAAAAIYMASQASENRCSQKDIGEVAGTAEATIRQVYRLMLPSASLLFPADFKFAIPIKDLPQS
ncbi:transcription initiation factor IIB-like [Artemia franciscana]|uniref:transcription initiation factor IIB-like n=1 Tax=Artemia franciscana TaxID=6661 RepID=UPI0032DAD087